MSARWTVLAASLLAAPAMASTDGRMEVVEVIGSHTGLPLESLSAQVSVIDRERIAALNKADLRALLETLAGVSINRQGGAGGITSLYVRGGEANFTVIMIDGVQVNNPVDTRGGAFDFATLDPAQVERIELLRGPQSAVYGAGSLSGVLNIVTRRDLDNPGVRLDLEAGSDEYRGAQASFATSFGRGGGASLQLGRKDSGDVVPGSDRRVSFANGALALDLADGGRIDATVRYSDSRRSSYPEDSGGPRFAVYDERERGDSEQVSAQLAYSGVINPRWNHRLEVGWFDLRGEESSPGIFPGFEVPPNGADIRFERLDVAWINRVALSRLRLGLGLEASRETGRSDGYLDYGIRLDADYALERDAAGGFLEAQFPVTDAATLSASARYDDVEQADSGLTLRLGLNWRITDATRLRANLGEGFKPPSFFALAHPLVGNPALESETATSWDMGIEHAFGERVSVQATWFDATYRNLVDFDDALFINVNRDRVETQGLEFSFTADLAVLGDVAGHATWMESELANSDQQLRGRPEWKAGLTWLYPLRPGLQFTAEYLWVDEVTEASLHTGQSLDYRLDAYHTLDLGLNWQASPALLLKANMGNALDENYQQAVGFPAAGRFVRLGLEWRP